MFHFCLPSAQQPSYPAQAPGNYPSYPPGGLIKFYDREYSLNIYGLVVVVSKVLRQKILFENTDWLSLWVLDWMMVQDGLYVIHSPQSTTAACNRQLIECHAVSVLCIAWSHWMIIQLETEWWLCVCVQIEYKVANINVQLHKKVYDSITNPQYCSNFRVHRNTIVHFMWLNAEPTKLPVNYPFHNET